MLVMVIFSPQRPRSSLVFFQRNVFTTHSISQNLNPWINQERRITISNSDPVFERRLVGCCLVAKVKGHGFSEFAHTMAALVYLELASTAFHTPVQWRKLYAFGLRRSAVYRKKTNVSKDFIGWDDLGFGW